MAKSLTKSQIIEHLATKLNQPKKLAGEFLAELVGLAYKEAKKDFVIPGLGKIVVSSRKKRKGRNPKTGEEITIPARKVLSFRFLKAAKDAVLSAAPAKEAPAKKAAAKPAAKPVAKAAPAKKVVAKPAVKEAPAKKAVAKPAAKPVAKAAPAKKAPAKKAK